MRLTLLAPILFAMRLATAQGLGNACCNDLTYASQTQVDELAALGISYAVEQDIGEDNCQGEPGGGCEWWEWQCTDSIAIGNPPAVVGLWCQPVDN